MKNLSYVETYDAYKCDVCHVIPLTAYQCSHTTQTYLFCEKCVQNCQLCSNNNPDPIIQRLLNALKVVCPNDGCKLVMTRSHFINENHELNCEHALYECDFGCGITN